MGKKNAAWATIVLLLFIFVDASSASFDWNFRKLAVSPAKGGPLPPIRSPNETVSPKPSPSGGNNSTVVVDDKAKGGEVKTNNTLVGSPQKGEDKKMINNSATTPTDHQDNQTKDQEKEGKVKKGDGSLGNIDNCDGMDKRCSDSSSMVACVKYNDDSKVVILIQNQGESSLEVNLKTPTPIDTIKLLKHQTINRTLPLDRISGAQISLNAGKGDCVLPVSLPVSKGNLFIWLPPYSKYLTPIYGAYALLLVTLVSGVVWACCCMFKKRKPHGEIPYQELEMGLPESSSIHVETADGWDEHWDDDWDEDKAVKSPAVRHPGSISANGLTSRSANRDGWEDFE